MTAIYNKGEECTRSSPFCGLECLTAAHHQGGARHHVARALLTTSSSSCCSPCCQRVAHRGETAIYNHGGARIRSSPFCGRAGLCDAAFHGHASRRWSASLPSVDVILMAVGASFLFFLGPASQVSERAYVVSRPARHRPRGMLLRN